MRTMKAKWAGRCVECGQAFAAGDQIAWTGQAAHVDCHAKRLEADAAEEADQRAHLAKSAADFYAGKRTACSATATEIVVKMAPSYKAARAAAAVWLDLARACGKTGGFIVKTREGKRYIGREMVSYCGASQMGHHEGYAFRYNLVDNVGSTC